MAPEARITGVETRRYRYPLDPPFRAAWDPDPAHPPGRDARARALRRRASRATRAATTCPTARCSSGSSSASTRCAAEAVREICETVDFHGGRPWTAECAIWDLAGRLLDTPVWRLLGGRNERLLAYASSGELVEPDERARRAVALRERGRARAQAALPPRRLARGRRRRRARARCGRRRLRADGRRQPGLAHGGRPRAALGRRHGGALRARARAPGRLLARGAAALRRRRGLPRAARA